MPCRSASMYSYEFFCTFLTQITIISEIKNSEVYFLVLFEASCFSDCMFVNSCRWLAVTYARLKTTPKIHPGQVKHPSKNRNSEFFEHSNFLEYRYLLKKLSMTVEYFGVRISDKLKRQEM